MDAHTLNAWTRFALQKGGIGSCTALIDNPATEPEDLMFMTGEKITVLRRLDEEGAEGSRPGSVGGKRQSKANGIPDDPEAWYLGYCEGVVGRFKGGHVRFHGKLKKPVLMRRSGAGSIKESSTRPMSKSEAATLPASQVPPGIPVTAVNSDGEEEYSEAGERRSTLAARTNGSRDPSRKAHNSPERSDALPSRNGGLNQANNKNSDRSVPGSAFGVTTPPLSDEGHGLGSLRAQLHANDSDEESDSMLPWARNSTGSSELSVSGTTQTSNPNASDRSKMNARNVANLATNLPPSPISSAESPVNRKPGEHDPITAGGMDLGERFPDASHKKKTSSRGSKTSLSNASTTTSEDDDADSSRRRDYTFSIYDVYGRDSVAFPNFSYKEVNGKGKRVSQWAGSTEPVPSLRIDTEAMPSAPGLGSRQAKNGPETSPSTASEPTTPRDPRRPGLAPIRTGDIDPGSIPAALRSPSGRRPNAAPDPRGLPGPAAGARGLNVNVASSLRRQVEAGSSCAPATSSPVTSDAQEHERQPSSPRVGGPGAFDPRRRPSAPNVGPPGPVRQGDPGRFPGPPTPRQMTGPPPPGFHQANVGPSRGLPRPGPGGFGFNQMMPGPNPGQPQPPGSGFGPGQIVGPRGPMAAGHGPSGPSGPLGLQAPMQRPRFAAGRGRPRSQSLSNAQLGLDLAKDGDSSSSVSPGPPSPLGLIDSRPPSGPSRAASDRSSERERGGSKDLRKNPSNPTPGVHGGLSVASASRSPSPFSGSDGRVGSARGTPDATSGGPSPSAGAPTSGSDAGVTFDAFGFVTGSGPSMGPSPEDPEAREKWNAILAENDLVGAKKSRKVKRLVRSGIPTSMRGSVWLFLANGSIRRRPGLFETLCKTSQGARGKKGKEAAYDSIDKDLHRCFPDHKLFRGENSTGRADLEAILKAYVHYNPEVGYTQGMGLVVGGFLIQMPAEDAFWLLCAVLREPHMTGYYANNMKQLHVDSVVFGNLLQSMDPELHQRLHEYGVEPIMYTANWFLPLFTRILPWPTLLRVWDVFFYEGPVWILRVALAIVRIVREPLMNRRTCPGHGEAIQLLLHPPQANLTPDNVLGCASSVKIKDGEMRKLSRNASTLVRQRGPIGMTDRGRSEASGRPASGRSSSAPARR